MLTPEEKKFPWKWLIMGIFMIIVLTLAVCDFAPKQTSQELVIQHTID